MLALLLGHAMVDFTGIRCLHRYIRETCSSKYEPIVGGTARLPTLFRPAAGQTWARTLG